MKIPKLKPRSPEFDTGEEDKKKHAAAKPRGCDAPGCAAHGEFRAPKSKAALSDFYWFCLDHVRDYNTKWDFFKGSTAADIDQHRYNAMVWDRPTWRMSKAGTYAHDSIRQRMYYGFRSDGYKVFDEFDPDEESKKAQKPRVSTPESEALAALELDYPSSWKAIRARYKELVKVHHPDVNAGSPEAEERVKEINMAYSILKLAHKKLQQLDERT